MCFGSFIPINSFFQILYFKGFGVCCVQIISTDEASARVDHRFAYLRNPNYPQPDTMDRTQTVTLMPRDDDTVQFRLDFLNFKVSIKYYFLKLRDRLSD